VYSLTTATPPFLTLTTLGENSGRLTINAATKEQHGTYSVTLKALIDAQATKTITISIVNPCSTTTFETNPNPLNAMAIQLANSGTVTQSVKVYTALERSYPALICPITATISET